MGADDPIPLGQPGLNGLQIFRQPIQRGGGMGLFDLLGATRAHDGGGHLGSAQHPGDGEMGHLMAAAFGEGLELVDEGQVGAEFGFLEATSPTAPVVGGQGGDIGVAELPGQEGIGHGAVGHDADTLGYAIGQQFALDGPIQQAVWRLQGGDGVDGLKSFHLGHGEVGDPGITDLALGDQLPDGRPSLFDIGFGIRPVDLIEVDGLDTQPSQAVFRLPLDAFRLESAA